MADYFSLLTKTIAALDRRGPDDRRAVYERARRALAEHLRAVEPPQSDFAIRTELALLEAAIRRAESNAAKNDPPAAPADDASADAGDAADVESILQSRRQGLSRGIIAGLGVAAAIVLAILGYMFTPRPGGQASLPAARVDAVRPAAAPAAPAVDVKAEARAPDSGLPYVYRRQPVYYRTSHPVGTVIVDKSQRMLYLVRPNVSALRYGVGVGRGCQDVAGLLRVTQKQEWPNATSLVRIDDPRPAGARPSESAGENPLGARALYLGSAIHLIHGTEAAKNVGALVGRGCFLLLNDSVIDLFDRVSVGAGVVVTD
jgi:lipoprotein-anchoring transpeptidase ErfK/SrfK